MFAADILRDLLILTLVIGHTWQVMVNPSTSPVGMKLLLVLELTGMSFDTSTLNMTLTSPRRLDVTIGHQSCRQSIGRTRVSIDSLYIVTLALDRLV